MRLLDEVVDVWRPVEARRVGQALYQLSDPPQPQDEAWSFGPGELVVVERRTQPPGDESFLVAVARASDLDERTQTAVFAAA